MKAINLETRFFLVSIMWGTILVLMYDAILIFRRLIPHNKLAKFFEDVIFWVASGFLIFRMMYRVNEGRVRSFSILGMLLGMIVIHYSISDYLVIYISKGIKTLIQWIKKFIKFISKPMRSILKRCRWIVLFLAKKLKKPLGVPKKALKKIYRTVTIALRKK